MIFIFAGFWFFMFCYQFRSPKNYDGRLDILEYAFCSNIIVSFPKRLIAILFFNVRLTDLPLPLVVGQIGNYMFMAYYYLQKLLFNKVVSPDYFDDYLTVWFIYEMVIILTILADFEIFYRKNKWKRL